jgi:hypothetical protein
MKLYGMFSAFKTVIESGKIDPLGAHFELELGGQYHWNLHYC